METLARSYIDKRIREAWTYGADRIATIQADGTNKTRAELARDEARKSWATPAVVASHLLKDDLSSINEKGDILAEAYQHVAQNKQYLANHFRSTKRTESDVLDAIYQRDADRSRKIAQGLTRAAWRDRKA